MVPGAFWLNGLNGQWDDKKRFLAPFSLATKRFLTPFLGGLGEPL
jgi:hypothetical protein